MENTSTETQDQTTAEANIPPTAEQPASSEQPADLNIQDLVGLKSVVDVATQRGAFRANELEAVGKLYNRLEKFIESVSKKEA